MELYETCDVDSSENKLIKMFFLMFLVWKVDADVTTHATPQPNLSTININKKDWSHFSGLLHEMKQRQFQDFLEETLWPFFVAFAFCLGTLFSRWNLFPLM